jgi:16S rRNA (guanine966-N2)-methyltransferase
MRVIAGSAKGVPLQVPAYDLRPTMDKTRGAIFSALGDRLLEAQVLDLFAGSGSFGIEALSRGASSATFVDNHSRAVQTIRRNLVKTRLSGAVVRQDALRFLERSNARFDLIFADPPYVKRPEDRNFANELLNAPYLERALTENGLLILERADQAFIGTGWQILRSKRYGDTEVLFLARA